MKNYFTLLALLVFASFQTFAQNKSTIKGSVINSETKEPINNATIRVANTVVFTNENGLFELTDVQSDSIQFEAAGYTPITLKSKNKLSVELIPSGNLDVVIVTANRAASKRSEATIAISKLSQKLIDETKASSVHEIINKTPGVVMPSYNNEQHGMAIRQPLGTSAYYLYLEDGVPVRPLGIFNHNALLEVNQFAIQSIEVVKGPVSSIYGPEAVGGAINFIQQRPTTDLTAKIGVQFDNWGFKRVQFGTGATIKKFGYYISGLSSDQKNSWLASSDYTKSIVNARLEYALSSSARIVGNFIYGDYYSQMSGNTDSIAFYSRQYTSTSDFTYRKSKAYRSRLTLEKDWNNGSKSFVTLFQRNNKHGQNPSYAIRWNPVKSATNDPTKARGEINSNDFESYGIIAQHTQKLKFLNTKITVGTVFDYTENDYYSYLINLDAQLRTDGKSVEKYTIREERPDIKISNYTGFINNSGNYLQVDFKPIEKLSLSFGGRYDIMSLKYINNVNSTSGSITYNRFTPKCGANYKVLKNISLYANVSQGFSPPSLTAIFRPRPNTNPVEFYTNLQPAVFNNFELGSYQSYFNGLLTVDLAFYQMNGFNELLNIRQQDNSFDYQSAGRTLHRGVEFGLTSKPTKELSIRYGGTVALHRFEDFQISTRSTDAIKNLGGFEMPTSPRYSSNGEIYYYPKWLKNFRTSLEWQYLSSYFQNQINTVKYEGYHLINFRAGYSWKGVELYANLMNLTDALYATSVSRGNNPTDRSTFNAGAPRTIVIGIQYNFKKK